MILIPCLYHHPLPGKGRFADPGMKGPIETPKENLADFCREHHR
jgi:hypothetical protein